MGWLGFAVQNANLGAKHDVRQIGREDDLGEVENNFQKSLFLSFEETDGGE